MRKLKFLFIIIVFTSVCISQCLAYDIYGFVHCTDDDTLMEPATGGYALLWEVSSRGPSLVDSVDIDANGNYTFVDPPSGTYYQVEVRCVDFDNGSCPCNDHIGCTYPYIYKKTTTSIDFDGSEDVEKILICIAVVLVMIVN